MFTIDRQEMEIILITGWTSKIGHIYIKNNILSFVTTQMEVEVIC